MIEIRDLAKLICKQNNKHKQEIEDVDVQR